MSKVAIVIGHSISSQGAENKHHGLSEFEFNESFAFDIAKKLTSIGIAHEIIYRDEYDTLPAKINATAPKCIVSLHCNAFNGEASGSEMLYYHSSEASKQMAQLFQDNICEALSLNDRGILPRHSEDRGGYLLRYTDAPCIIAEPFFIDNDNDIKAARDNYEFLVSSYVNSIKEIML